jgi:hypothetical protein
MLRKVLAFLLLLSHVNTSMLLPQVSEQDAYDSTGSQINDINSLVEFVNEVILDHHNPPVDEDDDNGQNFHIVKMVDYAFQPFFSELHEKINIREETTPSFPIYNENKIEPGYADIVLPPPKA